MANGKHGDHPLTDLLHYGERTMPGWVCDLVLEIHALDPTAFHESAGLELPIDLDEYKRENGDWFAWERGENLDFAREFLGAKLNAARERAKKP
jgi:hypothetical protein